MASMEGLAPDFQARLSALVAASGGRITLTSGRRSRAEQAALYKKKPKLAAPPGKSNHEHGEAADLAFKNDAARKWAHANAAKFGLKFPMKHEPWHIERVDLKSKKGAYTKPWKADDDDYSDVGVLTPTMIAKLARHAGFTGEALTTAVAIALAESRGNARAIGDTKLQNSKWGPSVSIWQVRTLNSEKGKGTDRDQVANMDPARNAKSAFNISGGGKNFKPWSVYTKGLYQQYLPAAKQAVAGIDTGLDEHGHGEVATDAGGDVVDRFASAMKSIMGDVA